MATKLIQAKHLDDDEVVAAIREDIAKFNFANAYSLNAHFPRVPHKVIRAKITALIRKGRIDGCGSGCDCSSPIFITEQGDSNA